MKNLFIFTAGATAGALGLVIYVINKDVPAKNSTVHNITSVNDKAAR